MRSSGTTTRAAVQLTPADRDDISAVRQAAYYAKGVVKARFFLVDLPDVLGAGFVDHLRRLQQFYKKGEFPFSDSIAPRFESMDTASQPPKYSLDPDFQFDLNCLKDPSKTAPYKDLLLTPGSTETLQRIKELTTLDDGQAVALYENLNRRIAFTQGPPGTGKTFLGVAEAEVILKSQSHEHRKPIVVVCMTNHALDDFLASLLKRNINKVVRLGTRSSCDWIERFLLHTVSRRVKANSDERRDRFEARSQADSLTMLGMEWAEELSTEPGIRCLQAYLVKDHQEIAKQFEYLDRVSVRETDYRLLTRSSAGYAFKYWITGGDLESIAALISNPSAATGEVPKKSDIDAHASVLKVLERFKTNIADVSEPSQHIWNRDLPERHELLRQWLAKIDGWSLCEAFAEIHRRHQLARTSLRRHNQRLDARSVLEQKIDIVALTATGCARNWEFLEMLKPHTFLMEEASELTEASTIAALVPSAQHLIQIGDPQQLRPHISLRPLCKEYDDRYRLDESLFERLMPTISFSRLNTQRRAHPDLADLLRSGDYPYLIDHPSTEDRPEAPGLKSRIYWVHHDVNEDVPDPSSPMAKSHSNRYEAQFISSAVRYLIERHGYRYNTITILTPYNGQVALFVRGLKDFCKIVLTNEDKEALVDAGMLETDELDSKSAVSVELGALLRVTTIDNYQGEENDVVFFSPVRSNKEGSVGFLKNQNRINVAISRARNGFFVVGNSLFLENVPQWEPIVSTFKHKIALGRSLPVQRCSKHCNEDREGMSEFKIGHPDAFRFIRPCAELCGQELPCGHLCQELCHPEEMHTDGRILCKETCGRILPCGHQCQKECYQKCEPCVALLKPEIMSCGHMVAPLCSQDRSTIKCNRAKGEKELSCGHTVTITCDNKNKELECDQICGRVLDCGHKCPRNCYECVRDKGCPVCKQPCGKDLPCGHKCAAQCHGDTTCPRCEQPCKKACQHGRCQLPCSVICDPCIRESERKSCEHQEKPILCCLPGTYIPCSKACRLFMLCGHKCPGLCGEPCPKECPECSVGERAQATYTLPCEHTFTVKELDQKLGLESLYSFKANGEISGVKIKSKPTPEQLQCPECGSSTLGSPRYALAHQVLNGQDIIGRLYAKVGRRLRYLSKDVEGAGERLFVNVTELCARIKPGPLSVRQNHEIICKRLANLSEVRNDVLKTRDELAEPIEEAIDKFSKFMNHPTEFPVPILCMKLRYERLHYRCRYLVTKFYSMVITQLKKMATRDEYIDLLISVFSSNMHDLTADIAKLDTFIRDCQEKHLKRLEVEFVIAKTSSVIVARNLGMDTPVMTEDLKRASNICLDYPDSAGCLRDNLQDASNFIMSGISALNLEDRHKASSRNLWDQLGRSDEGGPQYCANGHVFFHKASPKGCPECGK